MVPPPSHKVSRVSWYSGYRSSELAFPYGAFTPSGRTFQYLSGSSLFLNAVHTPWCTHHGLGSSVWALPRSLAATYGITIVFSSSPYLDVSVQEVPGCTLWIHVQSLQVFCSRFPHSEIRGSQDICSYPRLIAAYHVFHRLSVPRHPPYALSV